MIPGTSDYLTMLQHFDFSRFMLNIENSGKSLLFFGIMVSRSIATKLLEQGVFLISISTISTTRAYRDAGAYACYDHHDPMVGYRRHGAWCCQRNVSLVILYRFFIVSIR